MTNELDDGDFITAFTSAGRKNYGYKTNQGKVCCKVRGLTLNVPASRQLTYDVMKQNLLDELTNLKGLGHAILDNFSIDQIVIELTEMTK